jgi:paired amphipathic helix protein Sin3a
MPPSIYGQQPGQNQLQEAYEYQNQVDQQTAANAAALAHRQEHRGVSQLQSAASATAGGPGRPAMIQTPGAAQAMTGMGLQGAQADASKRGPVEFNHAISYVNKIKVS